MKIDDPITVFTDAFPRCSAFFGQVVDTLSCVEDTVVAWAGNT